MTNQAQHTTGPCLMLKALINAIRAIFKEIKFLYTVATLDGNPHEQRAKKHK